MTKTQQQAIANVIARLKKPDLGCSNKDSLTDSLSYAFIKEEYNVEMVSRLYLDTWIISALELVLEGGNQNAQLAQRMSKG